MSDFFMNDKYRVLKCMATRQIPVNGETVVKLSQQEIADILDFAKPKVNTIIRELKDAGYIEFAPQLPQNQAIADNRSIEQRICIKPAKRSRQRDLSLLVRFMQRRATPITQKDVSRR